MRATETSRPRPGGGDAAPRATPPRPAVRRTGALAAALALLALPLAAAPPAPVEVVVHADRTEGRLAAERFLGISLDSIYAQVTSPLGDPALAWVRATNGLAYVRCAAWLGDGIPRLRPDSFSGAQVAREGPGGSPVFQWEGLEWTLDALLAAGVRPVLVCAGMPDVLAAPPLRRNETGAPASRPRDYALYQEMVTQMLRRLVKTYGAEEVRGWYFEAWSQPDHEGSWEGGRPAPFGGEPAPEASAAFCRLYDHFAAAAAAVDPRLRIGGPGLAGDRGFLRRFLEHCARGRNEVTGAAGTRSDFISWCAYGSPGEVGAVNRELARLVEEFPELKGARLAAVEVAPRGGPAEASNLAGEAARLAALVDGELRAPRGVDLMLRAGDLVDDHFDGRAPLITRIAGHTIPTPAFRFFSLLAKMGDERLAAEPAPGVGLFAARSGSRNGRNAAQALLYRTPAEGAAEAVTVRLRFTGLPTALLRLPARVYGIPGADGPYEAWSAAGKPRPAPLELGKGLLGDPFRPAEESTGIPLAGGTAVIDVSLPPQGVALVTLGAEPLVARDMGERARRLRRAEEEYAAVHQAQQAREFRRAVELLRKIESRYPDTYWRVIAAYTRMGVFELDLRSPEEALAARRELLALPLDDMTRLRLLEGLRADLVRKGERQALAETAAAIEAIERRLAARRQWSLTRYRGE